MRTSVTLRCLTCGHVRDWPVTPGDVAETYVTGETVDRVCVREADAPPGHPGGCGGRHQFVLAVTP